MVIFVRAVITKAQNIVAYRYRLLDYNNKAIRITSVNSLIAKNVVFLVTLTKNVTKIYFILF